MSARDEAYPGELERLRALALQLRVVARTGWSAEKALAEARRLMDAHVAWEKNATAGTAPEFFQVGRTYQREHHGVAVTFKVAAISTSPDGRTTVAHGWRSDPYSGWEPTDSDDMTGWTEVTEEVTS